jgi:hypothetical protein
VDDPGFSKRTRLHQRLLIASVYSSHVKSTRVSYASRKFCDGVTSLELNKKSIKPSAFLPQKDACLIERKKNNKVKAMLENVMDFSNSQITKGKTMISHIGTTISMTKFLNLCINMNTIITAICSSNKPQPILHQILLNFVTILNNLDWIHWYKSVDGMPLLGWYSYSFLKRIFNCFADFATDFGNGNIISESCQTPSLTPKHYYMH